jgi:hypothetical protein
MMKSLIAATSLLCLGFAYGGALPARADGPAFAAPHPVMSASGKMRFVFNSANDCAPSQPEAVWGPGPPMITPLGYRCFEITNGG